MSISKDWTGNANSVFKTLGSSHHTNHARESYDYYATDPKAAKLLLEVMPQLNNIWECACGEKHLAKVFEAKGLLSRASDIINRCDNEVFDFLSIDNLQWAGDIVTNPPYKYAKEFIQKGLQIIPPGRYLCMFLKVQFLEGKGRKQMFLNTPQKISLSVVAE